MESNESNWDSTTADPDEESQPNLVELATFLKGPLDVGRPKMPFLG
jgi:hypothetical protein